MWIVTAWQYISPEVTVKGFKKCCISNAMDETDDDMLRMAMKKTGMFGVCTRKIKALTVKMEAVTAIDTER